MDNMYIYQNMDKRYVLENGYNMYIQLEHILYMYKYRICTYFLYTTYFYIYTSIEYVLAIYTLYPFSDIGPRQSGECCCSHNIEHILHIYPRKHSLYIYIYQPRTYSIHVSYRDSLVSVGVLTTQNIFYIYLYYTQNIFCTYIGMIHTSTVWGVFVPQNPEHILDTYPRTHSLYTYHTNLEHILYIYCTLTVW